MPVQKLNLLSAPEYSPGLQIEILQIETTQLKEPVLDIGCGKQGNLVNYLCENALTHMVSTGFLSQVIIFSILIAGIRLWNRKVGSNNQ